jgi:hypothetical protein
MALKILYCAVSTLFFLSLAFTFEPSAHAYVDPGSGLLVLQSLGAIFSGGLFYFRKKLAKLLSRNKPRLPDEL